DPRGWYASARKHRTHYHDLDTALDLWRRSAEAALAARERWSDRVVLLTYETLVGDTESAVRGLAERLGITIAPLLLTPTFNGQPIRANSSAEVDSYGVLGGRVDAYRDEPDAPTIAAIEERAGDLYEPDAASW